MKRKTILLMLSFATLSCASDSQKGSEAVEKVFARATQFHKTDPGCDPWTRRGVTSTQIDLKDNCDDTIGMVAVDPEIIPYGSIIYAPQNKRFYLACNRGGAVSARTAAKELAKKKQLSKKHEDAIVLDFYANKEIIDNHFGEFFVIKHEGKDFRFELSKAEQELRLDPDFGLIEFKRFFARIQDTIGFSMR
jgi:3D (Asp-Asp-Asp) domain-containing protein